MYPSSRKFGLRCLNGHVRRARGLTIVELLIVIAIMGVLAAVAAPNLSQLLTSMRIKNASFDFYTSLSAARSEAITRNTAVTITPTTGGDWATGWSITASAGTVTLKTQNALPGVVFAAPSGTLPASIVYNATGRLAAAISPIQLTATDAAAVVGRCITLDLSGRPVTTKGACP